MTDKAGEAAYMQSPCCAHMQVKYSPIEVSPHTWQGRWRCDSCDTEFSPLAELAAEKAKNKELGEQRDEANARCLRMIDTGKELLADSEAKEDQVRTLRWWGVRDPILDRCDEAEDDQVILCDMVRTLREALRKITIGAPTDADFAEGGKYAYDGDCGNSGDVARLGEAQEHKRLADIARAALATPAPPTTKEEARWYVRITTVPDSELSFTSEREALACVRATPNAELFIPVDGIAPSTKSEPESEL